jgi:hypothetical protein
MVKEIIKVEWQKCGRWYNTTMGWDMRDRAITLYNKDNYLPTRGKLFLFNNAAIIEKGTEEKRIRMLKISGGWCTVHLVQELVDNTLNDATYLIAYDSYESFNVEHRDIIIVVEYSHVLYIEYDIDGLTITARIDKDGVIQEANGLPIEVAIKIFEE